MEDMTWMKNDSHVLLDLIDKFQEENGYETKRWSNIHQRFVANTGRPFRLLTLKNHFLFHKQEYKLWKHLESTGDINCDPTFGYIIRDAIWWQSKIEIEANFERFQTNPIHPESKDLCGRVFDF
ncbi:hypothetical protein V2J09_005627 [Rumex salicifolius]